MEEYLAGTDPQDGTFAAEDSSRCPAGRQRISWTSGSGPELSGVRHDQRDQPVCRLSERFTALNPTTTYTNAASLKANGILPGGAFAP
jgi:hypothetical protein